MDNLKNEDDNLLEEAIDAVSEDANNKDESEGKNAAEKPEGLPDKFWDEDAGEVRIESLVKSYIFLEKKFSNDDDTRTRFLKSAGVPKSHEDYDVAIKDELFEPDMDLQKRLHDKGFTPEQVQEVYDLATDKMVPMILDMASEFQADREIERLIEKFGGEDKWREVSRQMLMFGQKNLPPQVLEGMSSSYEGILALYSMMQSGEPQTMGGGQSVSSNASKDLESMMRDPKYWREKDPAFIAKVTDGFKNLYGE